MLVVVTSVSLLVQVYSQGYMEGDGGYSRYFAYMSLFTASMLGLVLVDSILMVYVFWELVGSRLLPADRLLVPASRQRPRRGEEGVPRHPLSATSASCSAILLIWTKTDTFDIPLIQESPRAGHQISRHGDTLFALGLFAGAVGQVGAVPAARLAPGRDGGPDARLGADPRGDDGRGRRLPRRAHVPGVRRRRTTRCTSSAPSAASRRSSPRRSRSS